MADVDAQFLRGLFDEEGSLHTAGRTALYRLYGPEGLLYVGITICPLTRIRTHLREQPWRSLVIAVRIDYPDDPEAAERQAVRAEHPRHNVVFNAPTPPPPPDPAARLRTRLAREQRRLAELEATVPESATHLRLLTRAITTKKARIAKLAGRVREEESAAVPVPSEDRRRHP
ncbi:GIY-YIG nuclease family protein [Streptomyces sp. S3(2020)]|uniref:GIY-YIG nuclease family protein n=1 Tax=Streptomyces sp. S3(2020) TaxID=2732044 RepID=UPI001F11726E|nr:GIY-YIG nuclease family protein [Streptomyces sp. S3(2020)]